MKCTDRDIKIMLRAFEQTQQKINELLLEYKSNLIDVVKNQELKQFRDDSFFKELGKEAVLFKINSIYTQEVVMSKLINDAKDILDT